jgi:putative endopeptidase
VNAPARKQPARAAAALLLSLPLALACAMPQKPAAAAPPKALPTIGEWGFDLAGLDRAVKPGDDFFRFAGGNWMRAVAIPPDRARFGMFDKLDIEAEGNVRALLEENAKRAAASGTSERKLADFYAAFLDTAAIEAKGLQPIEAELKAIRAVRTHEELAQLIARPDLPLRGPLGISITVDQKNPDRYLLAVSQSGLELPDRDYYLKDEPRMKTVREKYLAHLGRVLLLAGEPEPQTAAKAVFELETEIARIHWDRAKSRERDLTYNLRSKMELLAFAPDYPWDLSLATAGVAGQGELVLRQLDAIPKLAALFRSTQVAVWRSKLVYSLLAGSSSVLPKAIDDEVFELRGRTLSGQPEQRERWKRGVSAVNGALGEAVGQLYVARHFPPDAKAKMLALVENVRRAYGARIDALPWMSAQTKAVAREKLAAFRVKIGYPDKWRDYSKLEIAAGDALGNARRAAAFHWALQVERLGRPTDRDEWGMTPQTVNAYYNPTFNEIVFPAAILQAPFFDANADMAINYGGIGAVIGHEMGHGFDDQGAKSDAKGILRTWWSEADVAAFKQLVDTLADQYAAYQPLPGLHLNGRLELGENIGDNGGLQVAFAAFQAAPKEGLAPLLDGFAPEQRFFLGWAQVWRSLVREEELRNRVVTDPHAPGEFRANGAVRNMDAWHEAFAVKEGDKLFLAPQKRVKIW